MKAMFKSAEGRVAVGDVDPTVTTHTEFGPDGQFHELEPSGETDDQGRDVYVEIDPDSN